MPCFSYQVQNEEKNQNLLLLASLAQNLRPKRNDLGMLKNEKLKSILFNLKKNEDLRQFLKENGEGSKRKFFGTVRRKVKISSFQAQNNKLYATTWNSMFHGMDHSVLTTYECRQPILSKCLYFFYFICTFLFHLCFLLLLLLLFLFSFSFYFLLLF